MLLWFSVQNESSYRIDKCLNDCRYKKSSIKKPRDSLHFFAENKLLLASAKSPNNVIITKHYIRFLMFMIILQNGYKIFELLFIAYVGIDGIT